MIQNVIFDIGNVLVTFQGKETLAKYIRPPFLEDVYSFLFQQDRWNQYDQGLLTKKDLIHEVSTAFPSITQDITSYMHHWFEHIDIVESSLNTIRYCQDKGYSVYALSNIPVDCFQHFQKQSDFLSKMDGGIYSFQAKLIKPDPKIYQTLCDTYQLNAQDCLFIDDCQENIETAKELGFHTIHCTAMSKLQEQVEKYI